jgi:hypothetical protein
MPLVKKPCFYIMLLLNYLIFTPKHILISNDLYKKNLDMYWISQIICCLLIIMINQMVHYPAVKKIILITMDMLKTTSP